MTALTQQQTACDQLNSTVGHSPFARPGSWAGASTAPATPTGMPSASASPFARPGSRAGSTQLEVDFPRAAPQAARPSNCDSPISSIGDPVFPQDVNTSTSWDVIDPDCNEEVAGITNGQSQHQVNRPANTNTDSDPSNLDLGLEQVSDANSNHNLGTLYSRISLLLTQRIEDSARYQTNQTTHTHSPMDIQPYNLDYQTC